MSTLNIGDPAPALALPDENGTIHDLANQRGKWTVVYFYPNDDSPGCTTEACGFRDAMEDVSGEGATVWGVSPNGPDSHRTFSQKYDLNFTLLSDEDHAVADQYGAWGLKTSFGVEKMGLIRSTVLVDPEGKVARTWPKVSPEGHPAEVIAALQEIKSGTRAS